MTKRMKEILEEERPRERCLEHGPECLSVRELLAIIIGSGPQGKGCLGLAEEILNRGGQESDLFRQWSEEGSLLLNDISGLGEAGKARLLATFELARRYAQFAKTEKQASIRRISKNDSVSKLKKLVLRQISKPLSGARNEWIGFVPVYSAERIGEFCLLEMGTRFHVNFDPKNLFSKLFRLGARGFFLLHNHPAGTLAASESDHVLTHQLRLLGKHLNTELIDHGIITSDAHLWMNLSKGPLN